MTHFPLRLKGNLQWRALVHLNDLLVTTDMIQRRKIAKIALNVLLQQKNVESGIEIRNQANWRKVSFKIKKFKYYWKCIGNFGL